MLARFLSLALVVLLLLHCYVCSGGETQQPGGERTEKNAGATRPNILFIYVDDLGWKDAGYMGSDFYETPHLDQLAATGMVFSDAYAGAANCAPSRACLLSGQYSPRHKIFNVGTGPRGKSEYRRLKHVAGVDTLDSNITTWAQCLKEHGYRTGTFGKWHLSADPRQFGFDVNVGGTHAGSPPKGYYPPHPGAPGLENARAGEYLTDRISREANEFIRNNRKHPWLVYLTHFAVHTPIQPKRELLEKYAAKKPGKLHDNQKMATMIEAVDDGVGMILDTLRELGIDERTIVIFYSDNGGYGPATDMSPLKGYKGTFYEGGIRVPFFVRWPGVTLPGSTCNEPVTAVDLFPTLCEMVGAALPQNQPLDGKSIVPLLTSERKTIDVNGKPRALFWHFPCYLQSTGQVFDEQRDPLFRTRPCSVLRQGDWKLHQYFEDGQLELYNLKEDIGETTDLKDKLPDKTRQLLAILESWQAEIGAPIPGESNPEFDRQAEAEAINKASEKARLRK
jgi:arylsulfatase A-like enzyme